MKNLESYLTILIQEAVKEVMHDEFRELKEYLISSKRSSERTLNTQAKKDRDRENKVSKLKIIRPSELTEILSITTSTLWRMEKRGELPPKLKISNRSVGWLESDIEEWLESRKLLTSKEDI